MTPSSPFTFRGGNRAPRGVSYTWAASPKQVRDSCDAEIGFHPGQKAGIYLPCFPGPNIPSKFPGESSKAVPDLL